MKFPRLAARAVIVHDNRLLLVNAYPNGASDLWCAPGGGVMAGQDLPTNLAREVHEETGLGIEVEGLIGINEFKSPDDSFHQVDLFFRAHIRDGALCDDWVDPEQVVDKRRFFTHAELSGIRLKPAMLPDLAFSPAQVARYDPIEFIVG